MKWATRLEKNVCHVPLVSYERLMSALPCVEVTQPAIAPLSRTPSTLYKPNRSNQDILIHIYIRSTILMTTIIYTHIFTEDVT